MSASREKKARADATYVQHRNHQEESGSGRKHVLYAIAGGIVAVLAIALLIWDSGFFQRRSTAVTIDGEDFNPAVVQYYYQIAANNAAYNSTGPTFDPSTDADEQIYDEESGQTWRDYLLDQAIEALTQVTVLVHQAEAEGFSLPPADQAVYDLQMDSLDQAWRASGSYDSLNSYLQVNFGRYMDEDTLRELFADQMLADAYLQNYQDSLTYTEEELEDYYSEHADELDTFSYSVFTIQASVEEETDEEGNPVEMTEEETQAAFDAAKTDALALAQELQDRVSAGEDLQALADEYADDLLSSSLHNVSVGSDLSPFAYADWLYDAARQPGDVTLSEQDRSESQLYNYYVVQFDSRERDESPTADVRHILISAGQSPTQEDFDAAQETAQALLDQWQAEGGTEDAFATLAAENSTDSGSAAEGGLYTGISSLDGLEPNFLNWALDPARQPGDTGIVKNESSIIQGWHIMYFVGWDDPTWIYTIKSTFKTEDTTQWSSDLADGAEVVRGSGLDHVK